ncbi:carbonic anhydrase 2-like [Schistocerca piceifrons]|uniref:carbonic anhydrase 2-like n=1 Tax=Schistocerca piceifrons TaxID=274613 RepID=UPI001F5E95C8|nr:carbonic anhydrase 2-like [Schistocerca piceifrons]
MSQKYCEKLLGQIEDITKAIASLRGPHTWPSGAAGRRQSPVNVRSECVQQVDGCPPLLWPGYDVLPCKLSLSNDGTAAVLCGCWGGRSSAPALSGGPLGEGCWPFAWAEFHWGPSDDEGSEHTLDYCRYALELQVVHGPCEGAQYEYVCVAVLFEAVMEDNPYMDPVVQALHQVRRPGCCTQLLPFPLDWLSPPMEQSYLSYSGSLTRPPCSEGVLWILRPHPLTISSRQCIRSTAFWELNNLRRKNRCSELWRTIDKIDRYSNSYHPK